MGGQFPEADGAVESLPPWRPRLEAVVAMTGHGYLCLEGDRHVPRHVQHLAADGFGGLSDPRVVSALAGSRAGPDDIDSLDVLLVAPHVTEVPEVSLVDSDAHDHPRVAFARRLRDDLRILRPADSEDDVVVVGTGLAGLPEISIELAPDHRGSGRGAALLRAALTSVSMDDPVVAMVAPGNTRSLRSFLTAGFTPIGSAQLWHRHD